MLLYTGGGGGGVGCCQPALRLRNQSQFLGDLGQTHSQSQLSLLYVTSEEKASLFSLSLTCTPSNATLCMPTWGRMQADVIGGNDSQASAPLL